MTIYLFRFQDSTGCQFYLFPEHGRFITQKFRIHWDILWRMPR